MADKDQKKTKKKDRWKLFDVVDKIGNGIKTYGPGALMTIVAIGLGIKNKKK